jgi:hypothetical protein
VSGLISGSLPANTVAVLKMMVNSPSGAGSGALAVFAGGGAFGFSGTVWSTPVSWGVGWSALTVTVPAQAAVLGTLGWRLFLPFGTVGLWVDQVVIYQPVPTLLDRIGRIRTASVPISNTLTAAAASQLGDTYLGQHTKAAFKGAWTVSNSAMIAATTSGTHIHPSTLLLDANALVRFDHLVDPDSGNLGRDGQIASVSYDATKRLATVAIDDTRDNFDALLARFGALTTPFIR